MKKFRNFIYKKKFFYLILFFSFIFFSSCSVNQSTVLPQVADYEKAAAIEKKDLKLGVIPGPYGEMFMNAVEPLLKDKGYSVELVYFDDYIQPNIALANNEIDMNMFQHYKHLNNIKFEYDLALSAISEIPTASMGIFSFKYDSLQTIDDNITVAIPNDNTNLSRALQVLELAGLIIIDPSTDKSKATLDDISKNPYNLQFVLEEPQNLVKSLDEYDLSVINGNYAFDNGLKLSDALYNETLADGYINIIVVRTKDLSSKFASDIIDAVYSEAYKQAILQNDLYKNFQLPRNFFDNGDWGSAE